MRIALAPHQPAIARPAPFGPGAHPRQIGHDHARTGAQQGLWRGQTGHRGHPQQLIGRSHALARDWLCRVRRGGNILRTQRQRLGPPWTQRWHGAKRGWRGGLRKLRRTMRHKPCPNRSLWPQGRQPGNNRHIGLLPQHCPQPHPRQQEHAQHQQWFAPAARAGVHATCPCWLCRTLRRSLRWARCRAARWAGCRWCAVLSHTTFSPRRPRI